MSENEKKVETGYRFSRQKVMHVSENERNVKKDTGLTCGRLEFVSGNRKREKRDTKLTYKMTKGVSGNEKCGKKDTDFLFRMENSCPKIRKIKNGTQILLIKRGKVYPKIEKRKIGIQSLASAFQRAQRSAACSAVGGAFAKGHQRRSAFQQQCQKSHIPVTSLANSHHPRGASSTSHDSISIMESEMTRRSARRADVCEFSG